MLNLNRVCIPIGLACDLHCLYCYRDMGKIRVPRLNDLMKKYLSQLKPQVTEAVIISGGEPLLYWERIKELFEFVPTNIHKKVITNGTHLNQEIVNYINSNNVELMLSHDGPKTKELRGVDVLEDPNIVNLLKQVEILRVNCVVTNRNTNLTENYNYIVGKLGRDDFYISFREVYDTGNVDDLIKDFNIDEMIHCRKELSEIVPSKWAFNKQKDDPIIGVNVLPNGDVCSMNTMKIYGNVNNTLDEIIEEKTRQGDYEYCNNRSCRVREYCNCMSQIASPFFCKVREQVLLSQHARNH